MLKVIETAGPEGKLPNRLSISVVVGEGESAETEFSRVRDSLLEWQNSGRSARGALAIEIQTDESRAIEVLHTFMRVVSQQEARIHQLYMGLQEAEVCTVSPSGKRIKKIGFAH